MNNNLVDIENQSADHFDLGVSFPMGEGDYNKTREQINAEQHEKDAACLEIIREAVTNDETGEEYTFENITEEAVRCGKIDRDYARVLRFYYTDGMETYREAFFSIADMLGIKKNIKIIDPATGKTKVDDARLGQITPNNCAVLEYIDRLEYESQTFGRGRLRHRDFSDVPESLNPVFLTMPGLKSITRTLAKYEKYFSKYQSDKNKISARYSVGSSAYEAAVKKLHKPAEAISDIARCSISVKRLQNVRMWADFFADSPDIKIDKSKTKDKFCANDVHNADKFTENNFRNYVFFAELPSGLRMEIQIKITALDEIDKLTHPLYEQLRDLKRKVKHIKEVKEKLQTEMEIHKLEYAIKGIYRLGIEKHNQNEVFDKVYRVEEQNRISGHSQTNEFGLDIDAVQILERNFLARPKQAFVREDPIINVPRSVKREYIAYRRNPDNPDISPTMKTLYQIYDNSPYLQKLLRDCPEHLRCTIHRYLPYITSHYRGWINGQEGKDVLKRDDYFAARSEEEYHRLQEVDRRHMNLEPLTEDEPLPDYDIAKYAKRTKSLPKVKKNGLSLTQMIRKKQGSMRK